jgi:hypothetical protein
MQLRSVRPRDPSVTRLSRQRVALVSSRGATLGPIFLYRSVSRDIHDGGLMDTTVVEQVVAAIWPLVAGGAAGRLGERGADEFTSKVHELLEQIRGQRADRGIDTPPSSPAELQAELEALCRSDERAATAMQTIVNVFNGPVDASGANFGIINN